MLLKYVDAIVCVNEKYRFEVIDYQLFSTFLFLLSNQAILYFFLRYRTSNYSLIFLLSISNSGCMEMKHGV